MEDVSQLGMVLHSLYLAKNFWPKIRELVLQRHPKLGVIRCYFEERLLYPEGGQPHAGVLVPALLHHGRQARQHLRFRLWRERDKSGEGERAERGEGRGREL